MNKFIYLFIFCMPLATYSQTELQATVAVGNSEGTLSVQWAKDWGLGKAKKFGIGAGLRFTSYIGANQYYTTAPANLTSGRTGPLVIFTDDIVNNIDTFLIQSPQVNSLNLMLNLRYAFSNTFEVGFNIDVIGFSFGASKRGNYINGYEGSMTQAQPTAFNLLLTSDNDKGSLNSEFYGKYYFNKTWGVKVGAQFHFTEYTTDEYVQQYPEPNDRFRNKSLMIAAGVVYKLK